MLIYNVYCSLFGVLNRASVLIHESLMKNCKMEHELRLNFLHEFRITFVMDYLSLMTTDNAYRCFFWYLGLSENAHTEHGAVQWEAMARSVILIAQQTWWQQVSAAPSMRIHFRVINWTPGLETVKKEMKAFWGLARATFNVCRESTAFCVHCETENPTGNTWSLTKRLSLRKDYFTLK